MRGYRLSYLTSLTCLSIVGGYDMNKWIRASEGGYTRASCDCEIRCTPESVSETCGADVVVGVDMENFNTDKKELVTHFIDHLTDQLDVGLTFNRDARNSARMSLFGFADAAKEIRHPLTFEMFANSDTDIIETATNALNEASGENAIDMWYYVGTNSDLAFGFEHAKTSMNPPRDPKIMAEMDSYGFHHTRLIVLVTDGTNGNGKKSSLKNIRNKIHDDNIKVAIVTLSEIDSPHCRDGGQVGCPNMEFLSTIGDIVIDGKDEAHAARQVMRHLNGKKCHFDGGCKPCDCECSFPRGPAGPPGEIGCDGPCGGCGHDGDPGMDGMIGKKGPGGNMGAKGECGPCGIPGLPGSGGEPGPDGFPSVDGNPGVQGDQGPVGPDGDQGLDGVLGFDGVPGPEGFQGIRGTTGVKGTKGEIGVMGDVLLNVAGGPKFLKSARTRRAIKQPSFDTDTIIDVAQRFRRDLSVAEAINAANAKIRDGDDNGKKAKQADNDDAFYAQFAESEAKWNQYLMDYYDSAALESLSFSIRGIIQEWMQDNIDVINCILNCNDCGLGGEKASEPGEGGTTEMMTPLKCEEPVDVVFMVDGSDSVSARDWPLVLDWTNNLIEQISPEDREFGSSAVFQQFSRDPETGQIPEAIMGVFAPEDPDSVENFKTQITNTKQSAQGTNTYETLNKIFGDDGLYYTLPTVAGLVPDGEDKDGATVFITLSDGESRDRESQRDQAVVDKLKKLSRMQIAVGVGKDYNKAELFDFAQDDKHILTYDDVHQLVEAGQQIINLIQEGCKSNGMRDAGPTIEKFLEEDEANSYDSDPSVSDPASSFPSMESYESELYQPMEGMESEDPRMDDIGLDFLDWTYYNRHDKRHRHR